MDHAILAASDPGLDTRWVGAFHPEEARAILELPEEVEPIAINPLAALMTSPRPKRRKSVDELVRYEHW